MNAAALNSWLEEHELSREWLADQIGKSLATLMRALKSNKPPRATVLAISHVTGIPVEDLVVTKKKGPHKAA